MISLYPITSGLHAEAAVNPGEEKFILDIENELGENFSIRESFDGFGRNGLSLIYVRTGGTESIFKTLNPDGPIYLLTSGKSNSLAASMEILSYLHRNGREGEIIHGTARKIAGRIKEIMAGQEPVGLGGKGENAFIRPLPAVDLSGQKAGVIGTPSDWLISSDVDYSKAKEKFGLRLVDIPMEELLDEMKSFHGDTRSFDGSVAIYEALKRIVERHSLTALTMRCFDLLDTLHNTGCLALARLNSEGIPASCEGDIPALISMMIAHRLTGCPGFQCNLSRIDGDELLFAHCTVPLTMVSSYKYATHFESGLGTAIKGEIKTGPATVFKVSPDLESMVSLPCRIERNENESNLCRTQIIVNCPGAENYFLRSSLANHHIIVPGEIVF